MRFRSLVLATALATLAVPALARSGPSDARKWKTLLPTVRASTDCIARAIVASPTALGHARQENWVDRLAVHAGRLQGHDRAPGRLEPLGKLEQSARRRREPAHLALNPTFRGKPQAGHHFPLVHGEPGTALMQRLQGRPA